MLIVYKSGENLRLEYVDLKDLNEFPQHNFKNITKIYLEGAEELEFLEDIINHSETNMVCFDGIGFNEKKNEVEKFLDNQSHTNLHIIYGDETDLPKDLKQRIKFRDISQATEEKSALEGDNQDEQKLNLGDSVSSEVWKPKAENVTVRARSNTI